jgi:arylsulfatase A-like enzyme
MEKKPNILIITTDQQRFDAIGAIDPLIYSPNLNQLAKEGALYTHSLYAQPGMCTSQTEHTDRIDRASSRF